MFSMWKQFFKQFLNDKIEKPICTRALCVLCAVNSVIVEPAQKKC